ncbi:hypothetical protein ACU4GD_16815 [Cupriavidus basilensis]
MLELSAGPLADGAKWRGADRADGRTRMLAPSRSGAGAAADMRRQGIADRDRCPRTGGLRWIKGRREGGGYPELTPAGRTAGYLIPICAIPCLRKRGLRSAPPPPATMSIRNLEHLFRPLGRRDRRPDAHTA